MRASLVAQLLLYHSRGCPVCKQGATAPVPHGVKTAPWYPQLLEQRVKHLRPEFVGVERTATLVYE